MGYEFEGVVYGRLRDMQAARRARYAELLKAGMNFTQAAHAVGVSKRTGKVWRNGRTRSTGRNEGPLVDWYAGRMGPERDRQAVFCFNVFSAGSSVFFRSVGGWFSPVSSSCSQ